MFRVRALGPTGDYTFGRSNLNFLVDSPAAVAQCVGTRLKLWEGEWFLNLTEGTPWLQGILGKKNLGLASALIRERVMGTPFVTGVTDFSFFFNSTTIAWIVTGKVSTFFGPVSIDVPLRSLGADPFTLGTSPVGGPNPLI